MKKRAIVTAVFVMLLHFVVQLHVGWKSLDDGWQYTGDKARADVCRQNIRRFDILAQPLHPETILNSPAAWRFCDALTDDYGIAPIWIILPLLVLNSILWAVAFTVAAFGIHTLIRRISQPHPARYQCSRTEA